MSSNLTVRLPLALLALAGIAQAQADPSPGFTLTAAQSSANSVLLDENGATVHTFTSTALPGLGVYLNHEGNLLRSEHPTGFGGGAGAGGRVKEIAWDGTVLWNFDYHTSTVQQHHDIEPMPNGNVLMIAWEDKTTAEAIQAGRAPGTFGTTFLPDHIVEVEPTGPTTGNIVWEWHAWDHLIQQFDGSKDNFGVVADHPELINVNYPPGSIGGADWMHSNSVAYNPVLDQIVISVRTFDEIWVIDHSTTTAEAAGHTGGASGKGGDLLYRWGNPEAYGAGVPDDAILSGQHDTSWVEEGFPGAGNIVIFNNNAGTSGPFNSFSAIVEIIPPMDAGGYILTPGSAYGPALPVWEYTAANPTDFYTAVAGGGAQRLSNGNTLVSSPNQGWVFEVDPAKNVVWEKTGVGSSYIARRYERYLWTDGADTVSIASGGTVDLDLVAGAKYAGDFYLMLGSAGGTLPGLTISGVHLPLNPFDAYFNLTLNTSVSPLSPAFALLDGAGMANVTFTLPAGLNPSIAGLELNHAFGVWSPIGGILHASNAEPLTLVP